ncbi:MAG: hypothetical protein DBY09_04575 [Selenomonadales bacterium]|nr:MAG: hypothetical protein DBY09_04575 [Selenomonadales bacterium]
MIDEFLGFKGAGIISRHNNTSFQFVFLIHLTRGRGAGAHNAQERSRRAGMHNAQGARPAALGKI